jgi:hypothetical protein
VRTTLPELDLLDKASQWLRPGGWRHAAAAALMLFALAATGAIVAVSPWFVGFGLAVVAAAAWCAWLERHPD